MDTLELRKYYLTNPLKSKKSSTGNITFTATGAMKPGRMFIEFYINSAPLSGLLDKFYNSRGSILDNWIGVLGSFENYHAEIIKVKQLLGKSISDKEIRACYPSDWNDDTFQSYLGKVRKELADPEIIIYCCTECGDYDCGGLKVRIDKTDDAFIWTFTQKDERLTFEFDKYQYFDLFQNYARQLERKN
jgi:hypothetical protein